MGRFTKHSLASFPSSLLPSLACFFLFLCRPPSPAFSESTCCSPPRTRTSNHGYQKKFKRTPLLLIFLYQFWDVESRFHNTEDKIHLPGHVLGYFLVSYQTVAPRFQAPTIWCLQSVRSHPPLNHCSEGHRSQLWASFPGRSSPTLCLGLQCFLALRVWLVSGFARIDAMASWPPP